MMVNRFPFKSRADWNDRIKSGYVRINDRKSSGDDFLKSSDFISHHNPKVKEPAVPDHIDIIDETDDYIVVVKPAPMPVHPGGRYYKNTLIEILKERGYKNLKIIHRLDAVTSGLLIFGKNPVFTRKLFHHFQKGNVIKQYYALVSGHPVEDEKVVDISIRRKEGFRFTCDPYNRHGSKLAKTRFEVRERFHETSLISCYPQTGRTHQLRLHLQFWGYPIYDDPIYGPDNNNEKIQKRAISLFNAELKIPGLGIDYLLPPPSDWTITSPSSALVERC